MEQLTKILELWETFPWCGISTPEKKPDSPEVCLANFFLVYLAGRLVGERANERGLARLQFTTLDTRKRSELKSVPSLGSLLGARRWAKREGTIRQRRRPWKRRWKIDIASFHFFSRLFQGAQLLKRRELLAAWSWREGTVPEFWQRW